MAAPRGRGLRPGGVVRALARLVLMVAVGFLVGLAFGLVMEEPELLARHLQGESEAVALRTPSEGADAGTPDPAPEYTSASTTTRPLVEPAERAVALPEVAAPARTQPTTPPDPVARVAEAPAATPVREAPVAASAQIPEAARRVRRPVPNASDDRAWAIQVGAFSERKAARRLAEALSAGYPVEVLPAGREGGRWRVRVQPIDSEAQARQIAEQLKQEERLPTWVTPMEGRSG